MKAVASGTLPHGVQAVATAAGCDVDWLWNTLTVSGPADQVARFRALARGTNAAPWYVDLDHEEARLLAPMAAAGVEARLLARALREVIASKQERIRDTWAGPGRCLLDLYRLLPVPHQILHLGADHPAALGWLHAHWGTTRPLRNVSLIERLDDRRLKRSARFPLRFQSADRTPWQAIRQLRVDWKALVFDVQPDYGNE